MNKLTIECPEWYQSLLRPLSDGQPCGKSLEYENDFILLINELEPRIGAEFGDFVETVEPFNFVRILKQAETLLKLSIDIRLIIIIMRCRLHLNGLAHLAEGLQALRYAINAWPDEIYPQLWDEGEYIPFLRTNAFSDLASSEGLVKELRGKKITFSPSQKLTIGEFEKASFGLIDQTVTKQQLQDQRDSWSNSADFTDLQRAAVQLSGLKNDLIQLQNDVRPEFSALESLLHLFTPAELTSDSVSTTNEFPISVEHETLATLESGENNVSQYELPPQESSTMSVNNDQITNRDEAKLQLQKVREWFKTNEPSSPIINLLIFTEQLIGKNFLALMKVIPAELIQKLELEEEKE